MNNGFIEFETKCHAHLKEIGWDYYDFWIILEDPNKKNHQDILIIVADDEAEKLIYSPQNGTFYNAVTIFLTIWRMDTRLNTCLWKAAVIFGWSLPVL